MHRGTPTRVSAPHRDHKHIIAQRVLAVWLKTIRCSIGLKTSWRAPQGAAVVVLVTLVPVDFQSHHLPAAVG